MCQVCAIIRSCCLTFCHLKAQAEKRAREEADKERKAEERAEKLRSIAEARERAAQAEVALFVV